jgi:small neutral amino acid transporter SnatA (MarC family)
VIGIAISVWFAYRYAARVSAWLGHTRMMAILRLSAFIVLCIGVQIGWNGIRGLLDELDSTAAQPTQPTQPTPPAGELKR